MQMEITISSKNNDVMNVIVIVVLMVIARRYRSVTMCQALHCSGSRVLQLCSFPLRHRVLKVWRIPSFK